MGPFDIEIPDEGKETTTMDMMTSAVVHTMTDEDRNAIKELTAAINRLAAAHEAEMVAKSKARAELGANLDQLKAAFEAALKPV